MPSDGVGDSEGINRGDLVAVMGETSMIELEVVAVRDHGGIGHGDVELEDGQVRPASSVTVIDDDE